MAERAAGRRERPAYGWDAPGIMIGFLSAGGAGLGIGLALLLLQPFRIAFPLGLLLALASLGPLVLGCAMLQYGLAGKLRTRDAVLDHVSWRGDETVLDVGTGAGLLLVGAAKRLTTGGRAIGIDIWSAKDLSNNAAEATIRNLALEGVAAHAEVRTADATRLPFADASFEVVLSLLCLHNIEPKEARVTACREIARVLKAGGRVVIGDYVPTHGYAAALSEAGLSVRQSRAAFRTAGALMWLLVADKPGPLPPEGVR